MRPRPSWLAVSLLWWGCGEDPIEPAAPCPAPTLLLPDGSCIRPGVLPDGCAEGFVHDGGYGCEPILPEAACPPGQMAVPGEASCRLVMPCGAGRWGDIPIEATSVHVDQTYAGADSDGSAERPFVTVSAAYQAAAPGALVAIAAGSYVEDLVVQDKPARFWGVCPEQVELVGTGAEIMPMQIVTSAANGSEVHGLALRGPVHGLGVAAAQNVVLERLWIHDTGMYGLTMVGYFGPTSASLAGSLIERSRVGGVLVSGVDLAIDASVVRHTTQLVTDDTGNAGMIAQACEPPQCARPLRSKLTVTGSLVEDNEGGGVVLVASDGVIDGTVVRRNLPRPSDSRFGSGLVAQSSCYEGESCTGTLPSSVVVRRSLFADNHDFGIFAIGSALAVEDTVVRDTAPRAVSMLFGRGIEADALVDCSTGSCSVALDGSLSLARSLVERNHNVGVYASGAEVAITDSVVRDTLPRPIDQRFGVGIELLTACAAEGCVAEVPARAEVSGSLVERSQWVGIGASGSELTVAHTVVRDTRAGSADGLFGDGVIIQSDFAPGSGSLENVLISGSARAGAAIFGGTMALATTTISCAAFELDGELLNGVPYAFEDRGGNLCGCPAADHDCKSVSSGLTPPAFSDR